MKDYYGKEIEHFLIAAGAVAANGEILLSGRPLPLEEGFDQSRIFRYRPGHDPEWSHFDVPCFIFSIIASANPSRDGWLFAMMSRESEMWFLGDHVVNEKLPPADLGDSTRNMRYFADALMATGTSGRVYRRDFVKGAQWVRMDEGLRREVNGAPVYMGAINGRNSHDLYAIYNFAVDNRDRWFVAWHNGREWIDIVEHFSDPLRDIWCDPKGGALICGKNGTLLHIDANNVYHDVSSVSDQNAYIGICDYRGSIYLASSAGIHRYDGKETRRVGTGLEEPPRGCQILTVVDDVLWSIGFNDVVSFDGEKWKRLAIPQSLEDEE